MTEFDSEDFQVFKDLIWNKLCSLGPQEEKIDKCKQSFWATVEVMEKCFRRTRPRVNVLGSQYGEFEVIRKLLPQNTGFYVDVGANSPIECSNTWEFYKLGWRGLLVECLPSCWYSLLRHRPGDYLCPLAVTDKTGFSKMRVANTVSSIRPDWDIQESAEIIVETETLENILINYPQIKDNCSLLSIDVEGLEEQVLQGINWTTFRPKVIIIEAYRYSPEGPTEDMSPNWRHFLSDYNLHFHNQLNNIYVLK